MRESGESGEWRFRHLSRLYHYAVHVVVALQFNRAPGTPFYLERDKEGTIIEDHR